MPTPRRRKEDKALWGFAWLSKVPWQVRMSIVLTMSTIFCMIGFNLLADLTAHDPDIKANYEAYAEYCFDALKVLFGVVIGFISRESEVATASGETKVRRKKTK
jgi:hypothetical protein